MKRFAWRLQRLLGIKTIEEQKKRAELLELTEQLAQTQSALLLKKRILQDLISDITGKVPGERLAEQELFLRCSATNNKEIQKLKNRINKLESQQKEKIAEVLKARRFKEGLEKLRAKAKTEFISEQEKLEQKELDEDAALGFTRKMIKS